MNPQTLAQTEPLHPSDIPACVQILLDNPLWAQYGITEEKAAAMFRRALTENAAILVARVGEEIAGFIWYTPRGAWDRSGYIRLIGVAPRFQGRKIGEQLMAAAEAHMSASVGDIFLLVTDSNTAAQRFYHRLGYRQVGAIPGYIQPGITELIFHKKL